MAVKTSSVLVIYGTDVCWYSTVSLLRPLNIKTSLLLRPVCY